MVGEDDDETMFGCVKAVRKRKSGMKRTEKFSPGEIRDSVGRRVGAKDRR